MHRLLGFTLALALPAIGGCDQLLQVLDDNRTAELAPDVQVGALELRHEPSLEQLGAYYCPQVIDDPFVALGCSVAIGPPPPKSQLFFEFGVVVNVHNPNDIPVPALDVLLALTLFADDPDAQALGAICVSLCGTDDPSCDGTPRPGACLAEGDDVRSIEDFIARIPGLIADIATGQAAEELRKSTILAGGDVSLDLAFVLGIDQALKVFEKTAYAYVDALLKGQSATLTVPVRADGTVYFRLPVLGRIGVDFGPYRSSWQIL
ncbi:MAG: hypothetical protein CVU56_25755 [Deltaproteobacteria bacterium HGW-Deltaproteobacteria-14]|jgi:hypothetical protein|nr:MAG: hypothetical protein CVU56_25755 [Deltaproteobacteria bacterium HGW-Deltaproteobacteria-14]